MHHYCIVDVSKHTLPISLARFSNQIVFVSDSFCLCILIIIYNIIIIYYAKVKSSIFVLQGGGIPLMIASQNGHLDVVKTLNEAGANNVDEVGHFCIVIKCTLYCLGSAGL